MYVGNSNVIPGDRDLVTARSVRNIWDVRDMRNVLGVRDVQDMNNGSMQVTGGRNVKRADELSRPGSP